MATINSNSDSVYIDISESLELYDKKIINGRKEQFLYALCALDYEGLPVPLSRIELWLNGLITGDIPTIEPQSRNEYFLKAILTGDTTNLTVPQSRVEILLNKLANGDTDLSDCEPIQSRYEFLLSYLVKNGGIGVEFVTHEIVKAFEILYNTKERPFKQAILKGNTFLNVLSEPSLKNTMINTDSQKLNKGYDAVNTVDGEFKSAILKGSTKYRDIDTGEILESFEEGRKLELVSVKMPVLTTTGKNLFDNKILANYIIGEKDGGYIIDCYKLYRQPYILEKPLTGTFTFTYTAKEEAGRNNPRFLFYFNDGTTLQSYGGQSSKEYKTYSITINNKSITKIGATFSNLNNIKWIIKKDSIQLEQGSVATTYEPHKKNILTVNEDVTLRSNGSVCDELDLLTGKLTQRIDEDGEILTQEVVKTVDLTITDQDGTAQSKLHSFNDGHIKLQSTGLLPTVDYIVPTNNSYYIQDTMKLNTQYTSKGSSSCGATIDGKVINLGSDATFTTPSAVTDKLIVLDKEVADLMFIEGNQVGKEIPYFTGMKSVVIQNQMPILTTIGKNLFDKNNVYKNGFSINGYTKERKGYDIKVQPNTLYTITSKGSLHYGFFNDDTKISSSHFDSNTIGNKTITTPTNCNILKLGLLDNGVTNDVDFDTFQIEEGSNATSYEPHKTSILSCNEDVTLRGIGNVRDELNLVTSELTERVGDITLDGSADEGWSLLRKDTMTNVFLIAVSLNIKPRSDLLSNLFDGKYIETIKDGVEVIKFNNSKIYVNISNTKATTVEDFKNYIAQQPLTIQYQLATESIKTVDLTVVDQNNQPTQLGTFENVTHVSLVAENLIPEVEMEVATHISEELASASPLMDNISTKQEQLKTTIGEQSNNIDATMMATTEIYEEIL